MHRPRPVHALRGLAALALAAPAACAVENPGFQFATASAGSSTGATTTTTTTAPTTSPTASSVATTDTGVAETGTTPDGVTGGPTSTSSDPSDATTVSDPTPDSSTGVVPDTTGGCVETEIEILSDADGFYIAGGTNGGTTCDYVAQINETQLPCKDLNFGLSPGLRLARGANNFDAMYVVRFPKAELMKLKDKGVTSATAELVLSMYAAPPAVDLRVGMIKDQWIEGAQDGTLALGGDSSFAAAQIGIVVTPWSDPDGPRGTSNKVATLSVPDNYPDPSDIESGSFPIDPWLAAPELAEGLVVSFFKDDALGTEGPSINTRDNPILSTHPFLRVHACMP